MIRSTIKYAMLVALLCFTTSCSILSSKQDRVHNQIQASVQTAFVWPELIDETPLPPMPANIEYLWDIKEKTVVPRKHELHDKFIYLGTAAELRCMTQAIYFESKSEPEVGKAGVGYTVLNRTGHSYFSGTVCGVVQSRRAGGRCEFDWYCKGHVSMTNKAQEAEAQRLAKLVLTKQIPNPVGNSIFFRNHRLGGIPYGTFYTRIAGHNFYLAKRQA